MSEYRSAIEWVIDQHEGGFQRAASDPGNYYNGELIGTNWGVSAPVAREHGWTGRMEDMPRQWAVDFVYPTYWGNLDQIKDQAVATKILDMRLSGIIRANRYAQEALISLGWQISPDGIFGPLTIGAFNRESPDRILPELVKQHEALYRSSYARNPIGEKWFAVWLRRARDIPPSAVAVGIFGLVAALALGYLAVKA